MTTTLTVRHFSNAGFFSCCSVRLDRIITYFNTHKKLPLIVDSSSIFTLYKTHSNNDITFDYFDDYNNHTNIIYEKEIDYNHDQQFMDYSKLKYDDVADFIKKYFSPSNNLKKYIAALEYKYNINYENTCVLFYRGNDKITETEISNYNDYIVYAQEVLTKNPNITFFIQSDETEFIKTMQLAFPNNSFVMEKETRHMSKCVSSVDFKIRTNIDKYSKLYLAITIVMSKCKYIICGSGNCSIWIMLYRGNNTNTYQYLKGKWLSA